MRISDWSSDVCSSDLSPVRSPECPWRGPSLPRRRRSEQRNKPDYRLLDSGVNLRPRPNTDGEATCLRRKDRKSVVSGKSVSVRVDLGGRGIIKKKKS